MADANNKKLIALGKILRAKRKKLGISQDRIADELNLQQNTISQMEQGKHGNIKAYVGRLEKILNFPSGELTRIIVRGS